MRVSDPSNRAKATANGCRAVLVRPDERGVVATRSFAADEVVLTFHGPLLEAKQITDFTYTLEVGEGRFVGPSGEADDFVNHSCDPNCRVEIAGSQVRLRALRPIARGDEVTYDYSTLMLRDPTSFRCHCASASCRGVVGPYRSLPRALRREYEANGIVPEFVLRAARPERSERRGPRGAAD